MKLFKNKLFLVLFASLFAICLFNSKCFASFDFTYDNTEYSLPDFPVQFASSDMFFIVRSSSNTNYYISCFVTYNYSQNNGQPYTIDDFKFYFDSSNYVRCKVHLLESDSWKDGGSNVYYTRTNMSEWQFNGGSFNIDGYEFLYSSANIYESENSDTVVFQGARQPMEETPQVVLAEIVEHQETNKVMEEILGILPIVIVVIVSLIAIRKAIAFLRTLLHRS